MKIFNHKKVFILTTVFTVVSLLALVFINISLHKKIGHIKNKTADLDQQINLIANNISDVDNIKMQYDDEAQKTLTLATVYDQEVDSLKLSDLLHEHEETFSVTIVKLDAQLTDSFPPVRNYLTFTPYALEKYPIALEITGRFLDVGKYLEHLITHQFYVSSLKIYSTPGSSDVQASVGLFSYGVKKI
jgi:acyl carrier protein